MFAYLVGLVASGVVIGDCCVFDSVVGCCVVAPVKVGCGFWNCCLCSGFISSLLLIVLCIVPVIVVCGCVLLAFVVLGVFSEVVGCCGFGGLVVLVLCLRFNVVVYRLRVSLCFLWGFLNYGFGFAWCFGLFVDFCLVLLVYLHAEFGGFV